MGEFREDSTDAVKFHLFCFQCIKYPQSQKTSQASREGMFEIFSSTWEKSRKTDELMVAVSSNSSVSTCLRPWEDEYFSSQDLGQKIHFWDKQKLHLFVGLKKNFTPKSALSET